MMMTIFTVAVPSRVQIATSFSLYTATTIPLPAPRGCRLQQQVRPASRRKSMVAVPSRVQCNVTLDGKVRLRYDVAVPPAIATLTPLTIIYRKIVAVP